MAETYWLPDMDHDLRIRINKCVFEGVQDARRPMRKLTDFLREMADELEDHADNLDRLSSMQRIPRDGAEFFRLWAYLTMTHQDLEEATKDIESEVNRAVILFKRAYEALPQRDRDGIKLFVENERKKRTP